VSRTNNPQAKAESANAEIGHPHIKIPSVDVLAKVAAAAIIACYAVGLLAVNIYLLPYGVSDFNLFRARFVFTGLLLVSIFLLSTICPIFALAFALGEWRKKGGGKDHFPSTLGRFRVAYTAIAFLAIPFFVLFLLLNRAWRPSLEGYGVNALLGVILAAGLWLVRRARERYRWTSWGMISVYGLIASGVLVGIYAVVIYFSGSVYPNTPTQLGGSHGQVVRFLIGHDSVQGVRDLGIPIQVGSETTAKMQLLFTGDDFYIVQYGSRTFVLRSDIVEGINPEHVP
jgi:hypothetical protein